MIPLVECNLLVKKKKGKTKRKNEENHVNHFRPIKLEIHVNVIFGEVSNCYQKIGFFVCVQCVKIGNNSKRLRFMMGDVNIFSPGYFFFLLFPSSSFI